MAGVRVGINSGPVAASTLKTVLQVVAAANHRVVVKGWGVSFQGTSATDAPVLVSVVR